MFVVLLPLARSVLVPIIVSVPAGPGSGVATADGSRMGMGPARLISADQCPSSYFSPLVAETVDLIELNHFYDDLGRHSYDQVIFYEWSPDYCRFHVIAWYLVEEGKAKRPKRDPGRKDHFVSWYDRDAKVNRVVRSELYRETWSQVDPERANKKLLEEKYRVSLVKVPQELH